MSLKHNIIEEEARETYVVEWVAAASLTCILYDHVITFGDEYSRMWPARWSVPKVLFLLNRYLVEAMIAFNAIASAQNHLSIPFCVFFLRWFTVTITVTNAVVEGILVCRVRALYQGSTTALSVVIFFYVCGIITLAGLTIKDFVGEGVAAIDDFSALPGCYASSIPSIIAGYWIAPVIVESVLFGMIIFKAFDWRKINGVKIKTSPTLVLLARDSSIYFAAIFALLFANLMMFEYGPPFLASMLVTPANAVGCIAGSRMLLNLRGLSESSSPGDIEMSRSFRFARRTYHSRHVEDSSISVEVPRRGTSMSVYDIREP